MDNTNTSSNNNLTPTLNDQQIRENIDALLKGGKSTQEVQAYVDNYQKSADGSYTLKQATPTVQAPPNAFQKAGIPAPTFSPTPEQSNGFPSPQEAKQQFMDLPKTAGNALTNAAPAIGATTGGILGGIGGGFAGGPVGAYAGAVGGSAAGGAAGEAAKEGIQKLTGDRIAPISGSEIGNQALTMGATEAIGGPILSGAGKLLSKAGDKLPEWFIQKALPKLNPDNVDFALKNLDAGTIKSNLEKSTQAVKSLSNTINDVLSHPQYAEDVGNSSHIIDNTIKAYPESQLTSKKVVDVIKSVVPLQKNLVDKLANDTITLAEKNSLRQAVDKAVYPKFTDTPSLTANKQIAKAFTDSLRNNVKSTATETKPLFDRLSKEINLNTALTAAKTKIAKGAPVTLQDVMAGLGGGIPGIVSERVATAPSALVSAAKGIKAVSNASKAIPKGVGKATGRFLLNSATQR